MSIPVSYPSASVSSYSREQQYSEQQHRQVSAYSASYSSSREASYDQGGRAVEVNLSFSYRASYSAAEVEQVLADTYAKMSASVYGDEVVTSRPVAAGREVSEGAQSASAVILSFIEQRLLLDIEAGATEEELLSRIEAGIEGFQRGFNEAKEQLQGMGLLSPEIADDIGDTYALVMAGADELRSKYASSLYERPEPAIQPLEVAAPSVGRYGYAEAKTFDFALTTEDGDKVVIRASARDILAMNGSGAQYHNQGRFQLQVQGELDEQELAAINELLGDVTDLAGDFYEGDLDGAFEAALALDYDESEIAGFALQLTRTEVQRASHAYQSVLPTPVNESTGESSSTAPNFSQQLRPVGEFMRGLLEALGKLSSYQQPEQALVGLSEQVAASEQPEGADAQAQRFPEFVEKMLALQPE